MKTTKYIKGLALLAIFFTGIAITSCEDEPDKYEIAEGLPTVHYVRLPDPAVADSLITGSYLSNTICIVGDNLRSVYELYFNDQKAILNTSLMTDHTIIVDVPSAIPSVVTNKMYLVNINKDTVAYDFNIQVPEPEITSMTNEYATPGTEVTINGNYFIDDPNVPLSITMGNVPVTEITSISQNAVSGGSSSRSSFCALAFWRSGTSRRGSSCLISEPTFFIYRSLRKNVPTRAELYSKLGKMSRLDAAYRACDRDRQVYYYMQALCGAKINEKSA